MSKAFSEQYKQWINNLHVSSFPNPVELDEFLKTLEVYGKLSEDDRGKFKAMVVGRMSELPEEFKKQLRTFDPFHFDFFKDPFERENNLSPYGERNTYNRTYVLYQVVVKFKSSGTEIKHTLVETPDREVAIQYEQSYQDMMEKFNPDMSYEIYCDAIKVQSIERDRVGMYMSQVSRGNSNGKN